MVTPGSKRKTGIPIRTAFAVDRITIDLKKIDRAAEKAASGGRTIVVINGRKGEGKSAVFSIIRDRLANNLNMTNGVNLSHQMILADRSHSNHDIRLDYFFIDDELQTPCLNCHIVDRILDYIEISNLGFVTVNEDTEQTFIETLSREAEERNVQIRKINLPSLGKDEKHDFVARMESLTGIKIPLKSKELAEPLESIKLKVLGSIYAKGSNDKDPLRAFTASERSLLNFLAVLKFEVPVAFLENIYSTEQDGIYNLLHELINKGILKERLDNSFLADGQYSLVYSIASNTVSERALASLPETRAVQLHDNITRLLKQQGQAPLSYLFYHYMRSGQKREAALIAREILKSLVREKRAAAIACFNEYIYSEKLDQVLEPETRFNILLELGDFFALIGNMERAAGFFGRCRKEIAEEEQRTDFRVLAVEACRRECEILEKRGEFVRAEKLLTKTLEEQGKFVSSKHRAKLYNDLAWVQYRLGQFKESWENCLLVHKLLDEKSDPLEIAQAYNLMGALNWNTSKYDDAVLCYKKCLSLRETAGDEIGVASSYNNLGLVYRSMGETTEALEYFKMSMEIKQKFKNLPGLAAAHLNIALAYLDMEVFKEAEEHCRTACDMAAEIGNQQLLAECYGTMGEIFFARGRYSKARQYYFKDLRICHKTKSMREQAIVFRRLGELSLIEGKITEAVELLNQAKALNKKIGSRLEAALLIMLEGKILINQNKVEEGKRKLESASLELLMLGKKNSAAVVAAEIGKIYLEEKNEALAREYLSRAIALIGSDNHLPREIRELKKSIDEIEPPTPADISSDSGRFKALCRVLSMLRTAQSPEWFQKTITETARKLTGMSRAILAIETERKNTFKVLAASGYNHQKGSLLEKDVIDILRSTKQLGCHIIIAKDRLSSLNLSDEFKKKHPVIACYPLKVHKEVIAFLYLDSTTQKEKFSDDENTFLIAFTHMVAHGLERYLLSNRIEDLEKRSRDAFRSPAMAKAEAKFLELVGTSSAIHHIYELIDGIKDMDTTILLTGENGTGKDLVAKTIHYSSIRAKKPFVSLNCSAIPGELLESELFGHEKGAFTGAYKQRIGHFESANGGTILLNEIGDMPLQLQPKLLRVLEEQKFYRLGGTKEISTNVRIIAATNKDLLELVREGRFREDLYYRINIFPIRIPALRERKEDIEPLAEHFLEMYSSLYNTTKKKLAHETLSYLIDYDWPGNVRELENLINRLVIITKGDTILPEDLPDHMVKKHEKIGASTESSLEAAVESILETIKYSTTDPILPKIQGMVIKKMVEKTKDKTKAASLLGISKPTLYSKLKNGNKTS
ncbi:MAG: hypothetical protein B6D63_03640 [Candidatus Latescibacteria bacterium 4484_7]|nr:MAG: hypothetical protein B6D63_03640 [Candidatus Latescibacteria bacterium 4484_7]